MADSLDLNQPKSKDDISSECGLWIIRYNILLMYCQKSELFRLNVCMYVRTCICFRSYYHVQPTNTLTYVGLMCTHLKGRFWHWYCETLQYFHIIHVIIITRSTQKLITYNIYDSTSLSSQLLFQVRFGQCTWKFMLASKTVYQVVVRGVAAGKMSQPLQ